MERIMTACEQYRTQFLAYLYDLLEPAERQALDQHLSACSGCQTMLARAKKQQKLLGVAAKAEFPAVKFEPPPAVVSGRRDRVQLFPVMRWALAASILLVAGLGISGGWWTLRYAHDRHLAAAYAEQYAALQAETNAIRSEHQTSINEAVRKVQAVQHEIGKLDSDRATKWTALQQAARQRQLNVIVSGPQTVQPGAPNTYQISTRNLNNQTVPAHLSTRILNERDVVVYEQKDVASMGNYTLALPADLPLKPDGKLSLEIRAQSDTGESRVREELSLATPVYVTHLTTDKRMYRPGETVYFRSLTLDRFSFKPPAEDLQLVYTVNNPNGEEIFHLEGLTRLVDERGKAPVLGPDNKPVRGIGTGAFPINPSLPGGEYTLTVREQNNRFPQQQRKFLVNQYENPRLNKELDFTRKSYGPGDEVVAACKVSRVEGGSAVAGRPVTATIQIDGKPYGADGKEGAKPLALRTDDRGHVKVRFKLPTVIERGQGTLSVQFTDGGSIESLAKPIPIVVKKLQVEFFPEGGYLVAGVPNRVYFQVRTMLDKPAELKGRIVDQDDNVVVDNVLTLNDDAEPGINQGMGLFAFTPKAGRKYELKIDAPAGIEGKHELPAIENDGVVLSVPACLTTAGEPITAVVYSAGKERALLVGAYCRGRLMDHRLVTAKPGEATRVELNPAKGTGGVYRVTVFEDQGKDGDHQQLVPRAERLVYRRPAEQLLLRTDPDKKQYVPGDRVRLSVSALNEKEEPAPAIVLLGVVDKSVVTLADEKTARSMPTHYYLTTEVRKPQELEYADVLLGTHPKAAAALDLLLGTQGWRRFAEQNPGIFRQKYQDDAERLLVSIGQSAQKATDFARAGFEKLQADYTAQLANLQSQLTEANNALTAAQNAGDFRAKVAPLEAQMAQVEQERTAAVQRLNAWLDLAREVRVWLMPVFGVILVLVAGYFLVMGFLRKFWRSGISFVAAVGCLAAAVLVVIAIPQKQMAPVRERRLALGVEVQAPPQERLGELEQLRVRPLPGGRAMIAAPGAPAGADRPEGDLVGAGNLPRPAAAPEMLADEKKAELGAVRQFGMQPRFTARAPAGAAGAPQKVAVNKDPALRMKQLNNALQRMDRDARFVGKDLEIPRLGEGVGGGAAAFGEGVGGGAAAAPALAAMPAGMGGRRGGLPVRRVPSPLVVREYAHRHSPGAPPETRSDFVDTVCWQPALILPSGKIDVPFDLCDSVTSYQVTAVGHTLDGRIGATTTTLEARLPFTLEPKLPIEVTASDKIDIPVSIANNTAEPRPVDLKLSATGLSLTGQAEEQLTVPSDSRVRRLYRLSPSIVEGQASVHIEGRSTPFSDSVTRGFRIVPDGFPIVGSRSDMLEKVAENEIVLPETWVKGTLKCTVNVYPSTLADLQKGLEALLREPGGCFEQTSTSNYPNLLILDYLKESDQAKPEIEWRARDLLASGYQKLTAFECLDNSKNLRQGYEWFGGTAPAHEALTAYGLLQFRDMARVYEVDPTMVERTRKYLLSRKDGKGGFLRNPRALDTFGRAPDDITNAYIVWALTESGKEDDVEKELATLAEQAKTSKDPYFLSLVATSLINRGKPADGTALLQTVAGAQKEDGHLDAANTSITGSGGRDLQIETTALAVLGWVKANRPAEFNVPIQKAVKWLGQQRGGYGGFGSTQSTVLALKSLIAFAKANKKTPEGGDLRLFVGKQSIAQLSFPAGAQEALSLTLPEPENHLKPGKNSVRVEITGKNVFPYTLSWSYQTLKPASADKYPVRLSTHLDRETADEGETVHLNITVENTMDKGQGMAVAVVGLPAGLTLPEDFKQLEEYKRLRNGGTEKGLIGAWETRGRELILYWRDLAPKQKIEVPIDLICRVPGEFHGPASRVYLYYNADLKHWVDPLGMVIKAK
jgi:anti-sigma factor RsiW